MTKDDPKKPKAKTHKAHRKVFDVVPPGKSPAAPNSRSVIVGHKPHVQDDQFVPAPSENSSHLAGNPSEKRPLLDSHKKIELKPDAIGGDKAAGGEETKVAVTPSDTHSEAGEGEKAAGKDAASSANDTAAGSVPAVQAALTVPKTERHNDLGMMASEHLADLAVEQVVETETFEQPMPSASPGAAAQVSPGSATREDKPGASESPLKIERRPATLSEPESTVAAAQPKTPDDLLAETGAPDLEPQKVIVSTHHRRLGAGKVLLIFLLILLVVAITVDLLLDAGIIETQLNIPHTELIGS